MTSSLVGSEMCIRDRSKDGSAAEALMMLSPEVETRISQASEKQLRLGCGCLLYTSDAADDM
eukprot:11321131-Prorocentrum_lima.AAC.1